MIFLGWITLWRLIWSLFFILLHCNDVTITNTPICAKYSTMQYIDNRYFLSRAKWPYSFLEWLLVYLIFYCLRGSQYSPIFNLYFITLVDVFSQYDFTMTTYFNITFKIIIFVYVFFFLNYFWSSRQFFWTSTIRISL